MRRFVGSAAATVIVLVVWDSSCVHQVSGVFGSIWLYWSGPLEVVRGGAEFGLDQGPAVVVGVTVRVQDRVAQALDHGSGLGEQVG